jgi:hypothetical protein
MKRVKNHIRFAWVVLICFVAGQTMVYSHQHYTHVKASAFKAVKIPQPVQTVTETCNLCDMMHHTHMAIFGTTTINPTVSICETVYSNQHDYKGIALILSAGRSPPNV